MAAGELCTIDEASKLWRAKRRYAIRYANAEDGDSRGSYEYRQVARTGPNKELVQSHELSSPLQGAPDATGRARSAGDSPTIAPKRATAASVARREKRRRDILSKIEGHPASITKLSLVHQQVTWSLLRDHPLAENLRQPATLSRYAKCGDGFSGKHAGLIPARTNLQSSATIGSPPRVLRMISSENGDEVEDVQSDAGGGDTATNARHAGKGLVPYSRPEEEGGSTGFGGSGREQDPIREDVFPTHDNGLLGVGFAGDGSAKVTISSSNESSLSPRGPDKDGCADEVSGDEGGEVNAQVDQDSSNVQRAVTSPVPCPPGGIITDDDAQSDLRRFFPPNALIPRLPVTSLLVSPNCRGSGGGDSLYPCGRRRHPICDRPWSAGEPHSRQNSADGMRRRGGFTPKIRGGGDFTGSPRVSVMMAERLPRSRRPHTVASGFRDLGLTYCSRSQGGGGGGGHGDGSGSTPIDTWNVRGGASPAIGGSKQYTGSINGDSGIGAITESSPATLLHGGAVGGNGAADRSATRAVASPVNEASGPNPRDREEERRFSPNREELRDRETKNANVFGSVGPKGVHDARLTASQEWGAPRGRIVGSAVVGLTAEALGRSGVSLDRSGRIKFVEQYMLAFDEVWPVDLPALRPLQLQLPRPCTVDEELGPLFLMPMHRGGKGVAGRRDELFSTPPPLRRDDEETVLGRDR